MLKRKNMVRAMRRFQMRLRSVLNEPRVRRHLAERTPAPARSAFAVYFADAPQGLYQLEQWLPALDRLAATGTPVTLLIANADSAARLLGACELPIALCTQAAAVEDFIAAHHVQAVFYVNNNQANFTTLRINGPFHVHLSHGESEKSSMVSNQLKAYDAAFIAGPASRERILHHVRRLDASRLVEIGRPQLDAYFHASPTDSDVPVILYAPTWEGDSPAMAYSSLAYPGLELIRALRQDHRLELIFRPHPKTGTYSSAHARALKEARKIMNESPSATIRWSRPLPEAGDAMLDISRADVVITDISAIAMDAVGLDKPTVVLAPSARSMAGPTPQLTDCVTTWTAVPPDLISRILDLAHAGPEDRQTRFRDHVFGPANLGTGTERFIRASHDLLKSATD